MMVCLRMLRTQTVLLSLISRFTASMRAKRDYEVVNLGGGGSDGLGDLRAFGRKANLGALNGEFKLTTVSINTLRTGDEDLSFYITTVHDG